MKAVTNSQYGFPNTMTCLCDTETLMSRREGAVTLSWGWAGTENQIPSPADISGEQVPHTLNEPMSLSCREMAILRENDYGRQCQRRPNLCLLLVHISVRGQEFPRPSQLP